VVTFGMIDRTPDFPPRNLDGRYGAAVETSATFDSSNE
jgi:hypothetical protein